MADYLAVVAYFDRHSVLASVDQYSAAENLADPDSDFVLDLENHFRQHPDLAASETGYLESLDHFHR